MKPTRKQVLEWAEQSDVWLNSPEKTDAVKKLATIACEESAKEERERCARLAEMLGYGQVADMIRKRK